MDFFVKNTLIGLLAIFSISCSEAKPPPDASRKDILAWHAKHCFGSDTDVDFLLRNENPFQYTLIIDNFQKNYLTAGTLRILFINNISSFMKRIAESDTLKNTNGNHWFNLSAETQDYKGFTDTTMVAQVRLPSNLNVNWETMLYDERTFLKFLYVERNYNNKVEVHWYVPWLKPDYWK